MFFTFLMTQIIGLSAQAGQIHVQVEGHASNTLEQGADLSTFKKDLARQSEQDAKSECRDLLGPKAIAKKRGAPVIEEGMVTMRGPSYSGRAQALCSANLKMSELADQVSLYLDRDFYFNNNIPVARQLLISQGSAIQGDLLRNMKPRPASGSLAKVIFAISGNGSVPLTSQVLEKIFAIEFQPSKLSLMDLKTEMHHRAVGLFSAIQSSSQNEADVLSVIVNQLPKAGTVAEKIGYLQLIRLFQSKALVALDVVLAETANSDADVRYVASHTLTELGPQAFGSVLQAFEQSTGDQRQALGSYLGRQAYKIQDTAILGKILEQRVELFYVLVQLKTLGSQGVDLGLLFPDLMTIIRDLQVQQQSSTFVPAATAIDAIATQGSAGQIMTPLLIEIIRSPNNDLKRRRTLQAAIEAIVSLQDKNFAVVLPRLQEILQASHGDPSMQTDCQAAISFLTGN